MRLRERESDRERQRERGGGRKGERERNIMSKVAVYYAIAIDPYILNMFISRSD